MTMCLEGRAPRTETVCSPEKYSNAVGNTSECETDLTAACRERLFVSSNFHAATELENVFTEIKKRNGSYFIDRFLGF